MRPYVLAVLVIYAVIGAFVVTLGITTPPYVGDLTRLGGYREDRFGWTEPQQRFVPPQYVADRLDPGTDILVLGDSMTLHRPDEQTDPGTYWPNWLAVHTGWHIAALHRREYTIEDVLALPAYRAHPPKIFVLEIAERAITGFERVTADALRQYGCEPRISAAISPVLAIGTPLSAVPQSFDRSQPPRPFLQLSLGGHRLKHALLRHFLPEMLDSASFALDRADLFTSHDADTLLVYRDDLLKIGMNETQLRADACGLVALQREVEADGRTRFVVMMVPDKLSTYRPYVKNFPKDYPHVIPALAQRTELVLPRLDLAFAAALESGTRDLFLPNDTHIGVAGHRIVSETLLRELEQRGLVVVDAVR